MNEANPKALEVTRTPVKEVTDPESYLREQLGSPFALVEYPDAVSLDSLNRLPDLENTQSIRAYTPDMEVYLQRHDNADGSAAFSGYMLREGTHEGGDTAGCNYFDRKYLCFGEAQGCPEEKDYFELRENKVKPIRLPYAAIDTGVQEGNHIQFVQRHYYCEDKDSSQAQLFGMRLLKLVAKEAPVEQIKEGMA